MHSLIGENGAGKSTLVKILSGALRADAGEITLFGEALQPRRPLDAQKSGIVTAFQELSLIPDVTVAGNLFYGSEPRVRAGQNRRSVSFGARPGVRSMSWVSRGLTRISRIRELGLAERQTIEICKALLRQASSPRAR